MARVPCYPPPTVGATACRRLRGTPPPAPCSRRRGRTGAEARCGAPAPDAPARRPERDLPGSIDNLPNSGYIACYGDGQVFYLYFVDDLGAAPAPAAADAADDVPAMAGVFLPSASMPTYLALLQQRQPVFAFVDGADPARSCLRTNRTAMGREAA